MAPRWAASSSSPGSFLEKRQLSANDGAVARISRRGFLRDVRRLRLHDEGAHGNDAHARTHAVATFGIPAAAGNRNAASADAAPLRVGASGRAAPCRDRRRVGRTIRRSQATRSRPSRNAICRAVPAAFDVRHRGRRRRGGCALHRVRAVSVASRECRRCARAGSIRHRRRTGSCRTTSSVPPACRRR